MSPDEVLKLFAHLEYEWDGRNPPDNLRKGRFRNGWEDASVRRQEYSAETLRRLTWHNLGYRFGKLLGSRTADQIDEVYRILAASYTPSVNGQGDTRPDEEDQEASDFDWQAEVRGWCQRRPGISPALTDGIIAFFRLSFQNTRCPEKAWFGCHPSGVSLVVGGIYLAAINRNGNDSGLWLIVGQDPPDLGGIDYRPVRSAQDSQHPLVWAHADSLEVIPDILTSGPLWDSFRSATAKVLSSSRSASDRDAVQERRQKRRLTDFWHVDRHALSADEADQPASRDLEGYNPDGIDRRPLVERQIRERRGQREFRDALRQRYGDHCLVTGCNVLAVLEAAHINPYRGEQDNHPENGLLLRSDIHTLFDLDLLGIEPEGLQVELSPEVTNEYGRFAGMRLDCPADCRPSVEALLLRYQQFRHKLGCEA